MNKKGFTLIELLAVIVILAIIALIATPSVLNIIEDSRKGAAEASARVIANVAENYYAQHTLLHNERVGEIDLTGDILKYNGDKPYKGTVYFDDDGNAYIKMYHNGYCIIGDYDNTIETTKMEAKECEIKSLIIFMDLDGGKLEDSVLEYEQGDTYGELPTPTKDGYTFIGWFDKDGNKINKDAITDKSSTIYAKWEANTYTVTLTFPNEIIPETKGWNFVNGIPTKEITYDTVYGLLPTPTKDGYTFTGWYTSGGFKVTSDSTLIIANDHTLTGQYTPNEYLITYIYNNGNYDTTETVIYGTNYNLPTPTKDGYTFLGWYDGTTKIENNSVIKILSNKTYQTKWEAKEYEVTFKYKDGVTSDTTKIVIYDTNYGELPNPTRAGYIFQGWFTTGGITITNQSKVTIAEDHTLNALWSASGYTLTYNANGGTVTPGTTNVIYNNTYGELPIPTRTGYTFQGWFTSPSGGTEISASTKVTITGNHSIYAQWLANTYTVTFVYGNGTANTTAQVAYDSAYGQLPNPSRTGHTFLGWYTTGGVKVGADTILKNTNNHTLNAQWSPNNYVVTLASGYKYNNADAIYFNPVTGKKCSASEVPTTATGVNDTCMKWYAFLDTYESNKVKLLLDHNTSMPVQWNSAGGETPDTVMAQLAEDIKNWHPSVKSTARLIGIMEIVQIIPPLNDFPDPFTGKPYYLHSGTNSSGSYTGEQGKNPAAWLFDYTNCSIRCNFIDADSYGYWTSDYAGAKNAWIINSMGECYTPSVTIQKYDGVRPVIEIEKVLLEQSVSEKNVVYGQTYGSLPIPTREGYTFKGWYTSHEGGTQVTISTQVTNASNHTLYARWN